MAKKTHTQKIDEVFEEKYKENRKRIEEADKKYHEPERITAHEAIHSRKKHASYKWLYLIPIIILLYLGYANFIQNHEFNHFYDIGSLQDAKTPYLTPADRISSIDNNESRNLTNHPLTYFKIDIPKGAKDVKVQLKFKDAFENNTQIILGYQNDSIWSYKNTIIYEKDKELFSKYPTIDNDTYLIYKLSDKNFENARIQSDIKIIQETTINDFNGKSSINTDLRGGHTFYVYLNGSLNLSVIKQDINWYNGEDNLTIKLYDMDGNLIAESIIPDDGFNDTKKNTSIQQEGSLQVGNVNGVYELKFSEFDGIIRRIDINTNKIITNRLFLANSNNYIPNSSRNVTVYFESGGYSNLDFLIYHAEYAQLVKINNYSVNISMRNEKFKYTTYKGDGIISPEKNNIIVSISNGYLSFSEDGFFEPFLPVEPININELENIDYVILPKSNYTPVKRDGDWIIAEASFNLEDAYINNNQLSMMITVPHLSKYPNATIPIDYINITVYKYGILQR